VQTINFEAYQREKRDAVLRYARTIVGPNAAEDVSQEAWIKAWRAWGAAADDHLDGWMFRIVRNTCLDELRRSSCRQRRDDRLAGWPAEVVDLAEAAVDRSEAAAVWPALAHLSEALREALWLREVQQLTYAEIAAVQGVPVGTVMSRLHSARRKAARMLRKEGR
jgi:RNA polymerase sigma-70 factor (ECF subfamily)